MNGHCRCPFYAQKEAIAHLFSMRVKKSWKVSCISKNGDVFIPIMLSLKDSNQVRIDILLLSKNNTNKCTWISIGISKVDVEVSIVVVVMAVTGVKWGIVKWP